MLTAQAANLNWQGGTASYNTPADWVGGVVPGPSDNAINDNTTNNVVEINIGDPDWMVNQILAGNGAGDGAFVQNGQNVNLEGTNFNGSAVTVYTTPFRLGVVAGNTGVYTLNGGTINYGANGGGFNVGELGTGILNINGGTITGNGNFSDNYGVVATPNAVTATVGNGLTEGDYTWFEQGYYAANSSLGLPAAGSMITSVSQGDHSYTLAPSYTANNAVIVSARLTSVTITPTESAVGSSLSFLCTAGNGPANINYVVHHADSGTETGSLSIPDWFASSSANEVLAVGARVDALGVNFQFPGDVAPNSGNAPYLWSLDIPVTDGTAVTSIDLTYASGGVACIMGISSSTGGAFTGMGITGYNEDVVVEAGAQSHVASSVIDVVNQTNGAIVIANPGQFFVGNYGTAIYNLSGGSINVSNYIAIGRSGGNGTFNMTGGVLNQDGGGNLLVGTGFNAPTGTSCIGVLNQSGGTINCLGQFLCPENSPSTGTYNLSGTAVLNVNNWLAVGRNGGTGYLNVTNGSITLTGGSGNLDIGAGGTGTLTQTGGTITNTATGTWIGETDAGTWNMNGGSAILGQVTVAVDSTGYGTLTLNGGLFQATGINSSSSGGTSFLNFNGGTLQANANNANFISGLSIVVIEAGGAIIDSQGYNITAAQELDGNGPLTKLGTGTLALTGPNTYSGDTIISQGTLETSTATTSSGNNYTVANGAGFGVQVVDALNSQLNAGNVTFSGPATTMNFDLGAFGNPTSAPLNVTGTLTVSGTVTVNIADALPQFNPFPLIKYPPGGMVGSGASFVLNTATLPTGVSAVLVNDTANNSIDLNITGVNVPVWDGLAGGNWDIGVTTNWLNLGTGLPTFYGNSTPVTFNDSATGTTTVNLVTAVTPASVTVSNSVLAYTLEGTGSINGNIGLLKEGTGTMAILNTNGYTGPTVITGGTLSVTNLANGNSASAIGASSANPTNLVLAGGTLSYGGPAVAINRGYQMTASSMIDAESNLTLSGLAQVTGTSSAYIKIGPATLTYAGVGTNVLSVASGAFSAQVLNGTLILDGSAGGQTNTEGGDMYVGSGTTSGADLILTNTTLNCTTWFAIGRGNGTSGFTSTASLYNSTLTCPSGLSLGYANGLSGYLAAQIMSLYGNSQVICSGGPVNICENANGGATSTLNVMDNSSIIGTGAVVGGATSHGVLNLNSTGTSLLANGSGATFRVGGNAGSTDTGVGAINQTAGTLISGSNSVYLALGIGSATAYGSYNLSGGTLNRPTTGIRVGRSGLASFVQSGGTFNCGGEFSLASSIGSGNSVAAATFIGGTTTVNSGFGFRVPEAAFTAAVNIGTEAGGNASVVTLFSSGFQLNYVSGGNGTLNLNSGTLQLGGPVNKNNATGTAVVNLNGGTVQSGANNITLINNTPNSVNVYKGGVVFDSQANTATVTANLLATSGNGVYPAGGLLTISSGGGAGYIGAPLVTATTSGAGSGLMAIATVSAGVVTNVVITCPGQNYSVGDTVSFAFGGGGYTTAASTFVYTLQAGDLASNSNGGLTKAGNGTLYLNGTGTYTGPTLVNAGTLAGIGSVAGPVTVASGGTLAAGSSATTLGTNTIAGPLSFLTGSTNFMKVNKTGGGKDLLTGMSQVNYGGTLVISNQAGQFAATDSFKLFNATIYTGAFSAIVPATPGAGLVWNTNQLTVNGTLIVANGVNTNSTNITFSVSSGNLNLSWPADHLGWRLLVQTNSLSSGLGTNWYTWPNSTNLTSVSIPINPTNPTVFFRMVYP